MRPEEIDAIPLCSILLLFALLLILVLVAFRKKFVYLKELSRGEIRSLFPKRSGNYEEICDSLRDLLEKEQVELSFLPDWRSEC